MKKLKLISTVFQGLVVLKLGASNWLGTFPFDESALLPFYPSSSKFYTFRSISNGYKTASMNLSLNAFRWIVISLHFFLLLSCLTLFHQWSVLNQVPQGGASLTVCCKRTKWIPGCGAWGQTGSISSDSIKNSHASWVQVFLLHKLQSSSSTLLWAFSKH